MRIAVIGNYGAHNAGDEMILEGMLTMLREHLKKAEITVLSAEPEATFKAFFHYNIETAPKIPAGLRSLLAKKERRAACAALKKSDLIIVGGGGLFTNLTMRAYLIWGLQVLYAYLHKKPVIMYGQSLGPFQPSIKGKIRGAIVRFLFKKAAFIAVRDRASQKELKNMGIASHLMPDLALRTPPAVYQESHPRRVLISLRYMKHFPKSLLHTCEETIKWLANNNYEVHLCSFQEQTEPDSEIFALLKPTATTHLHENPSDIHALKSLTASSHIVIGMRLHSIIAAVRHVKPCIAISYAPKVTNFVKDAGLQDQLFFPQRLTGKMLIEAIKHLESSYAHHAQILEKYNQKAQAQHQAVERELIEHIHQIAGDTAYQSVS